MAGMTRGYTGYPSTSPTSYQRPTNYGATLPGTTSGYERQATQRTIDSLIKDASLSTLEYRRTYYVNLWQSATGDDKARYESIYKALNTQIDKVKQRIKDEERTRDKFLSSLGPGYKSTSSADGNKDSKVGPGAVSWEYNPPMVKAAYLGPQSIQKEILGNVVEPGTYEDALRVWDTAGSKGVIQASRDFPLYFSDPDEPSTVTTDETVYGFKFLYNPTEVNMGWGVSTAVDVAAFKAGQLLSNPITDAAMASSVTFSVILNRMLDMNHVTSSGQVLGEPYPYPNTLASKHAKGIYKRGTMYDMEYLFKAVNGKNGEFTSTLNGKSADIGWLNGFPVELHLGSGMQYLVRVTNVSVSHKIFSPRMVPIFSVVDLTCKRLPDISTKKSSGGGGSQRAL